VTRAARIAVAVAGLGAAVVLAPAAAAAPTTTYSSGNLATAVPDNAALESAISVSDAGEIVEVRAAVLVGHGQDDQLNFDLVGPDGTIVELAHDEGGDGNNYGVGSDCNGAFTEFSDTATSSVAVGAAPFVGSFRPEQPLSVYKGKASNGTWKLVVRDDAAGVVGTLWCWKLTITYAQADVGVLATASPDPAAVGSELVYTNVIRNAGPDPSQNTTLTATVPDGAAFVTTQVTQGTCTGVKTIVCALGTLPAFASATVTVVVTPGVTGTLSYSANVAGTPDPPGLSDNNSATLTTTVAEGLPDPRGCTVVGTAGDDVLAGTDGADVICGLGGNDRLVASGGDDVLYGDGGNDVLLGGDGDDWLGGGAGNDRLAGEAGNDVGLGGVGNDRIRGDDGNDWLKGGAGRDVLNGTAGDDVLYGRGDRTADVLKGGPGRDRAFMDARLDVRRSVENVLRRRPAAPKPPTSSA
jgi:uncharacterized repeat protein (TIGR01451 family)